MNRFYKLVSKRAEGAGFCICLDGKPVKAPSGNILLAPTSEAADLIVLEWAAQEEKILPETMPVMQLVTTCQDRVSHERKGMEAAILKYLDTDLLCYRAGGGEDEHQIKQNEIQETLWNPWLEWFEDKFGVKLQSTCDLTAIKHPAEAHDGVKNAVQSLDNERFTALQVIVPLTGSLILGLAFIEDAITPDEAFKATHIEEDYKAAIYNEDVHGRAPLEEKKDAAMIRDLEAAALFLKAL